MFSKVLIANRGEIAVRVMQACAEMGIRTVAVYSDADRHALHVRTADEAVFIGPSPANQSYLNVEAIIAAAHTSGAGAIHPGYGFLSENAAFAQACADAALTFIGPPPAAIRAMGSKIEAKQLARSLGLPLLPGYDGDSQDPARLAAEAGRIGYPVLIKASAGGGGRGMRVVTEAAAFSAQLEGTKREALAAFSDDRVLLERYVARPRHIEIQLFADAHGNVVHLGERECSIQRRHQKVIEEAPSPAVTPELRSQLGEAAVRLAKAIGYIGAGTVEFLLEAGPSGTPANFSHVAFLEMNTRLQVEHGVTELVTGLDLVQLQIAIAMGEPLPFRQEDVVLRGHAIQCRIYAEDPSAGFLPATGLLTAFVPAQGIGVRNDVGVAAGDEVSPFYDSILAKLIVSGPTRESAVGRTLAALGRYQEVGGVRTNLALLRETVSHPAFRTGDLSTSFLDDHIMPSFADVPPPPQALLAAAVALVSADPPAAAGPNPWSAAWRPIGAERAVTLDTGHATVEAYQVTRVGQSHWAARGGQYEASVSLTGEAGRFVVTQGETRSSLATFREGDQVEATVDGRTWPFPIPRPLQIQDLGHARPRGSGTGNVSITAPLAGSIVKVAVAEGDAVTAHQPLVILDAMKMEHVVVSPRDGTIARLAVKVGDLVQSGALLAELEA